MPRAQSGYEALAQDSQFSDEEDDDLIVGHSERVVPINAGPSSYFDSYDRHMDFHPTSGRYRHPRGRPRRNSSGVDIKAINARLEKWAEEIASKFKIGKKGRGGHDEAPLQIIHSVFVPPEGERYTVNPPPEEEGIPDPDYITKDRFNEVVKSVEKAISQGVDPKLIKQGSSGSYFMRNKEGKVVGVMKPKDEEPYGNLNPKTMKWIHRNLFPCFFGRSCLIPNLSYISEAAACVLDQRLRTFMVPYTDVVWLASKSFHYDFWDRRAYYRNKKPLPLKVGSFQAFLTGYEDANIFLRKHPWPDQYNSGFRITGAAKRRRRLLAPCVPGMGVPDDEEDETDTPISEGEVNERRFFWTEELMQNFREELEKLVILDYIMRNTDRGLDNWMVKIEWEPVENVNPSRVGTPGPQAAEPMVAAPGRGTPRPQTHKAKLKIGAIDNSLAFPWKHPDEWRSFPFGWLFLPVSLIGQPFSQKTRDHFLPLLTSSKWWMETQAQLRKYFSMDADFKERMFQKQMAVLKGQAFNVVETLKSPDQGPLELTRRARMHVWDDVVEVPIAVPLRMPSSDIHRSRDTAYEEEMDIGASASSVPTPKPPFADLPSESLSRFDLLGSEESSVGMNGARREAPGSPESDMGRRSMQFIRPQPVQHVSSPHIGGRSSLSRASHEHPRKGGKRHVRGYSLAGSSDYFEDDDLEGDIGYAAAEGMDGRQRKVIVERLDPVKTRNPVFSWC